MRKSRTILNSKGLSLLEVLIAVFILTIVAGPLLNMFVTNTMLLRKSYEKTDATYDAKTLMENLYPLGYSALFQKGTAGTPVLDSSSGKYYTISLEPGGPGGLVSGTACYMHLIVNSGGSGAFAGSDGKLASGSLPAVSAANLANLRLTTTVAGTTYALANNSSGAVIMAGIKPAGATPVLIINTKSITTTIKVTMANANSAACLAYAPSAIPDGMISVSGALLSQTFQNDSSPTSMLVKAILKTYKTSSTSTQESVFQNTFLVGNLP